MKVIQETDTQSILRFDRGEEFLLVFKEFLRSRSGGGTFFGLGAMENPEIAYYDIEKRAYLSKTFPGIHEVTNCSGNIARMDGEVVIHCHGTFADAAYRMFGGHLMGGLIGGTLEIHISWTGEMERRRDEDTGLTLLV